MDKLIPGNWVLTTLNNIAQWGSGGTPSRSISSYFNGRIPWIKTGDLNDAVLTKVEEFISEEGLKNSSAKIFPKGSVAIAMYGATIGKTGILGIDAATNQACAVAQTYEGVDNRYLFYYLRSERQNFIDMGKGGAQPNISQALIKEHPFPLPPTKEQIRISNKLDILFNHLDFLDKKLIRIPDLIKAFKEKVLQLAFDGKLSKDWRNNNLIKDSWQTLSVTDVAERIQYGYTESSTLEAIGPKFLRITDIQNGRVEWEKVPYCKISETDKKKYKLNKGDILFARTGATVGKSFLIEDEIPEAVFASYLIRIIPKKNYSNKYISYFFNSTNYWAQISTEAKGIGQPNVNGTVLGKIKLPVPSIQEQNEVVRKIEILFMIVEKIQLSHNLLRSTIEKLPTSVLKKAFKGELVSKDNNDEQAAELLNKILELKSKQKDKSILIRETIKKTKIMSTTKKPLDEEIRSQFKGKHFSFEQLRKIISDRKYAELKEALFDLMDAKEVIALFDSKQKMQVFQMKK